MSTSGEGTEDRLERVLNRVIDWIKYEEAKNAALVTLDGVGVGVILQWMSVFQVSPYCHWLKGSIAAFLLSLLVALSSFYPIMKSGCLHRLFAWRRSSQKGQTDWEPSILFFGSVVGGNPESFLTTFHETFSSSRKLEIAYAQEIIINSEIAFMKIRLFEAAFVISLLGFIVTCGVAAVHAFYG